MANFVAQATWTGTKDGNWEELLKKGVAPAQAPAPVEEKKQEAAPVKAAPVKKAPVKKEPKESKRLNDWIFENYENADLKFEGDKYIGKNTVHSFFHCKNTTIVLTGKLKSVNLEGCQKVTIWVDSLISEVNIMNCKVIKVFAMNNCPTCTVENSSEINLMLNHKTKGCKLFTTCVRAMWI